MKPTIKKLWLKALRSGKYRQTKNRLHNGVGFCCLGVLCDLHAKATKGGWEKDDIDGKPVYKGEEGGLPVEVMRWAGLGESVPEVQVSPGEYEGLAELNDSGKRFKTIADLIEKHL